MQDGETPFTNWIKSDISTANTVSIILLVFAAWAGIEAVSNVAGIAIPPETGMATNIDPDDTQRTNNGVIVGLGAIAGTVGIIIQLIIPRGEEQEDVGEQKPVFDEDLVKLTKWLCSRGTTTVQFFEWADVDNSGSIDMFEFANALRAAEIANLPPWEIEELVKVMDINSDGRINLPELDITLLNIRNALGIEFIPYVEEEVEDEAEEESDEDGAEEETEASEEKAEDSEGEDDSNDSEEEKSEEDTAEDEAEEETEESEEEAEDSEGEDDSNDSEEEESEEDTAEDEAEEETEESEDQEEDSEKEDDDSEEQDTEEPVEDETPKKKKKF